MPPSAEIKKQGCSRLTVPFLDMLLIHTIQGKKIYLTLGQHICATLTKLGK